VRFGITRCYVALRVHHHTAVEGMRTICVKMRPPTTQARSSIASARTSRM
jgi:hypothetical protein